jgi:hypothetical protein
MPAAQWLLHNDRPVIEIELSTSAGQDLIRILVADTGAGTRQEVFQLLLDEKDCLQCGAILIDHVQLDGAYSGVFPVYLLDVGVPLLHFDEPVPVIGASQVPPGFDGIACFMFLNRFHHGNFGNPDFFGLDPLPTP